MNISRAHNIITIKNRDEIKNIINTGKKVFTKFGLIFYKNTDDDPNIKIAILVNRKCGIAVKRNYIKRLVRHFIRDNSTLFIGFNRVIFLFNYKKDVSYQELKDEYLNVLKKT